MQKQREYDINRNNNRKLFKLVYSNTYLSKNVYRS